MMANVRSVISADYSRRYLSGWTRQEADVTPTTKQLDDQDAHKGAIEGDRPTDEQNVKPKPPALDQNGMPADCDAIAAEAIGASVDESQG